MPPPASVTTAVYTTCGAALFSSTCAADADVITAGIVSITKSTETAALAERLPAMSVTRATNDIAPSFNARDVSVIAPLAKSAAVTIAIAKTLPSAASSTSTRSPTITAVPSKDVVSKLTCTDGATTLVRPSLADAPLSDSGTKASEGAAAETLSVASA